MFGSTIESNLVVELILTFSGRGLIVVTLLKLAESMILLGSATSSGPAAAQVREALPNTRRLRNKIKKCTIFFIMILLSK